MTPRLFAFTARATWLDDDGRDRCPPLTLAPGRRVAFASVATVAAHAIRQLGVAHETLNELGAGYPPLDDALLTVDVKPVR